VGSRERARAPARPLYPPLQTSGAIGKVTWTASPENEVKINPEGNDDSKAKVTSLDNGKTMPIQVTVTATDEKGCIAVAYVTVKE
jgi:hypothetical protein